MRKIEDYSDTRLKSWCIHCGAFIADVDANKDHVPSQSLLTRERRHAGTEYERSGGASGSYLPQVIVCRDCNSNFGPDEQYLLCCLHATIAGSLYPDKNRFPEAANTLRSNRTIVRSLKQSIDEQLKDLPGTEPFRLLPDLQKINNVVLKNARGHTYHELGEPLRDEPDYLWSKPLETMTHEEKRAFLEPTNEFSIWPEVGSPMMERLLSGEGMIGNWIVVEDGRYRYSLEWDAGVTIRSIIWEYLATETYWSP